jgi:hypothetical protein
MHLGKVFEPPSCDDSAEMLQHFRPMGKDFLKEKSHFSFTISTMGKLLGGLATLGLRNVLIAVLVTL